MEYISLPFEIKQLGDEPADKNFFFFEGLASTYGNIDLVDDRIEKGAFTESLQLRKPKVLWQHRDLIGISVLEEDRDEGLFVRGKLPREDSLVKGRVIPQMELGSINTLSIGFRSIDVRFEDDIRIIEKADLFEYSPVTFAANPLAKITDIKTVTTFQNLPLADRTRPWDRTVAVRSIREHTGSTDKPSPTYRRYFMWFDSSKADTFGAYKLPYAEWIDGEFKAVPRALFAVKQRIDSTQIPEADKPRVLANVERYLDRMERSKSLVVLGDVEHIAGKKKFNMFLKSLGGDIFSKDAREFLSSLVQSEKGNSSEDLDEGNSDQVFCSEMEKFKNQINNCN